MMCSDFLRAFLSIGILLWSQLASAQMISAFNRERSGTLPKGRFFVSFVSISGSLDSLYGADGIRKPLSSNLSQSISFSRITQEEPARRRQLAGLFRSNGVSLEDSAGNLSGSINGTIDGKVPVLGYGITDTLGLYVSVPIIRFRVASQYQFNQSIASQKLLTRLSETDQRSTAVEIESAFNTSLESKLSKAGYQWNPSRDQNYLGDIQLMFLQTLPDADDGNRKQSIQPIVILPTATGKELQDLYGLQAGKGRFGLGLKGAIEQKLIYPLLLNFSASANYLFANRQGRRLPVSDGDELNESLDEDVQVSGGMQAASQAQLGYRFPKWVGLNVGLLWQREFAENLQGTAFSRAAYALASARTDRELFTSYASLDFNSIPSFLEGNFWFPAMAEIGIGLPLRGRNSISEPVIQMQGSLFF